MMGDKATESGRAPHAVLLSALAALVCAVLLLIALLGISSLRSQGADILEAVRRPAPQTISEVGSDYIDVNGNTRHVKTIGSSGETPAQLVARFHADEKAMQDLYPERK